MMKKVLAMVFGLLIVALVCAPPAPADNGWPSADPLSVARAVADRELFGFIVDDNDEVPDIFVHHDLLWEDGTLLAGVFALSDRLEEVGAPAPRYRAYLEKWGEQTPGVGLPIVHGDQVCVGQTYVWLYEQSGMTSNHMDKTDIMIKFLHLLRKPTQYGTPYRGLWMRFWQDDVHMVAPFLANRGRVVGNAGIPFGKDARELAVIYCRAYHDVLGDPDTGLYWHNPRAVGDYHWGRGNGWVAAGFYKTMKAIEDDPDYADDVEWLSERLVEMAETLKDNRNEHGTWNPDITDQENYPQPETSGSAFFTYMMTGMINDGRLGPEYKPVVEKAWAFLAGSVTENGDLTRVQPVGRGPITEDFQDNSETYGIGGVILAGIEMSRMREKR